MKDKILLWVFGIITTTAMPLIVSLTEKSPQWKLLIICVGIILLFVCQYGMKFLATVYQQYEMEYKGYFGAVEAAPL